MSLVEFEKVNNRIIDSPVLNCNCIQVMNIVLVPSVHFSVCTLFLLPERTGGEKETRGERRHGKMRHPQNITMC